VQGAVRLDIPNGVLNIGIYCEATLSFKVGVYVTVMTT